MRKWKIACYKQCLLFSYCFPQRYIFSASKCGIVWKWVKASLLIKSRPSIVLRPDLSMVRRRMNASLHRLRQLIVAIAGGDFGSITKVNRGKARTRIDHLERREPRIWVHCLTTWDRQFFIFTTVFGRESDIEISMRIQIRTYVEIIGLSSWRVVSLIG